MEPIRHALAELIRTLPEGSTESASLAWTLVAGPLIADRTRAESLDGKILRVSVCDESWRRQLESMKPELARALREVLGPNRLDSIVFRVASRLTKEV